MLFGQKGRREHSPLGPRASMADFGISDFGMTVAMTSEPPKAPLRQAPPLGPPPLGPPPIGPPPIGPPPMGPPPIGPPPMGPPPIGPPPAGPRTPPIPPQLRPPVAPVIQTTPAPEAVDTSFVRFSCDVFPSQKSLANECSLPLGALFAPFEAVEPAPPVVTHEATRCQICGAFISRHCEINFKNGQWTCLFCGGCSHNRDFVGRSAQDIDELQADTTDYDLHGIAADILAMSASPPPPTAAPEPPPVVLLIDETLDEDELRDASAALSAAVRGLSPATRVGLLTFGRSVAVHDLRSGELSVSADIVPGHASPTRNALRSLLYGSGRYLEPLSFCSEALAAALGALRPFRGGRPITDRPRALGAALEVALALLGADSPPPSAEEGTPEGAGWGRGLGGGRVLVVLGGPPNHGPGGLPNPEEEYSTKSDAGVAVDILAGGAAAVGVARLLPMVARSGGAIALTEGFGDSFRANAAAALTRAAAAGGAVDVRVTKGISVSRIIGPAEDLPADTIVGSLAKRLGGGPPPPDSPGAFKLRSCEGAQACAFFFRLDDDVAFDFAHFQFVARAVAHRGTAGHVRVVTRRLRTTADPIRFLDGVNGPTAAALVAKSVALRLASPGGSAAAGGGGGGGGSADGGDYSEREARADLAEVLREAVWTLLSGGADREPPFTLPRALVPFAESLYHLSRGPILGPYVVHGDEKTALRALLLSAALSQATAIVRTGPSSPTPSQSPSKVQPRLYLVRVPSPAQGQPDQALDAQSALSVLSEVPLADTALLSSVVLVMDAGTELCTWIGALPHSPSLSTAWPLEPAGDAVASSSHAVSAAKAAGSAAMSALSAGRFPVPIMRTVTENSSGARYLKARLAPLHKDAQSEQEAEYPRFRPLLAEVGAQWAAAAGRVAAGAGGSAGAEPGQPRLMPTDEPSFREWLAGQDFVLGGP